MKDFLYGRFDVVKGVRGYKVFKHHRDFPDALIKELEKCFTTKDPDHTIIHKIQEFYLYFPISGSQWILAKGKLESRGDYISYIVHGLLLEEAERQQLDYNPFHLMDRLNPAIGDDRNLPMIPLDCPELTQQQQLTRLANDVKQVLTNGDNKVLHVAGDIVTRLLTYDVPQQIHPLTFDYNKHLDHHVWHLCYHLLPLNFRRRISLNTMANFLKLPTAMLGSLDASADAPSRNLYVNLGKFKRSDFGTFLHAMSHTPTNKAVERFEILTAACKDMDFYWEENAVLNQGDVQGYRSHYLESLKGVLKGVDKPSVHALSLWSQTVSYRRLFPWKKKYFLEIWRHNRAEQEYFPNLGLDILKSLRRDYKYIGQFLADKAELARIEDDLDEVVGELAATKDLRLMSYLLDHPNLAPRYVPQIQDEMMVRNLFQLSDQKRFQQTLANHLKHKGTWPDSFDRLFGHDNFLQCPPKIHAAIFNTFANDKKTGFQIEQLLKHRYLENGADFKGFLQGLQHKFMISRVLLVLRNMMLQSCDQADTANRLLRLLAVCEETDREIFRKNVASWINRQDIEWMIPTLIRDPGLCEKLIQLWRDSAKTEWSKMRLSYLIQKFCELTKASFEDHDFVRNHLQNNSLASLTFQVYDPIND